MSSPTSPPDPYFRAVEFLREVPEPGWDGIANRVIAAVRTTARPGGQAIVAHPPLDRPGPGRIYVSDHVVRSTLAIALRQRYLCAPTAITLDIDTETDMLRAVHIELTGSYGTPLGDLAGHIRSTTVEIVDDLLGGAGVRGPVDITITDVVTGDPLDA